MQRSIKDKDENVSFASWLSLAPWARCIQSTTSRRWSYLGLGPFQQLSPLFNTNKHGWFQVTARNTPSRSGRAGAIPPTTALFLVT